MKTTFTLDKPNVKLARQIEATKSQVNKYIKRERGKKLPEGADYWDFLCKFGDTKESARTCHLMDIPKLIDEAEAKMQISFYIEITTVVGRRKSK